MEFGQIFEAGINLLWVFLAVKCDKGIQSQNSTRHKPAVHHSDYYRLRRRDCR